MEEELVSKELSLTLEDASVMLLVIGLIKNFNSKTVLLHDAELLSLEYLYIKIQKQFFPEEYNKVLH